MSEPIIAVEGLKKYFPLRRDFLTGNVTWLKAVDDVSFSVGEGETVSLVGESGCGKSTTAMLLLRLYQPTAGKIRLNGMDIQGRSGKELAVYRKSVQAMFQDPYSSLNPRMLVRDIIAEPLVVNTKMTRQEVDERAREVISQVGLPAESLKLYPHEFSGGQRQRIALARALALKPKVIVLDEPVSALDVSIKAQVMNLLKDLQASVGVSYLLISHNLADVRFMSQRVCVMYLGRIVESGTGEELFSNPQHPYTQALFAAVLPYRPQSGDDETIAGEVPSPVHLPSGCRFHPRCPMAMQVCTEIDPTLDVTQGTQRVACHLYGPHASSPRLVRDSATTTEAAA